MAQNLQNFVEQFFPSIAKRINFRFGTLRGINLYITDSEFPTCSVRNVVEQKNFFLRTLLNLLQTINTIERTTV